MDESVHESPGLTSRRRMRRHSRRLVDDDQVVVLEEDFERQRLGSRLGRDGGGNHQSVGARKGLGGAIDDRSTTQAKRPANNQRLDPRPRKVRSGIGEGSVDPARDPVRQFDDSRIDGLTYRRRSRAARRKEKLAVS